jgi:hypothetical protein
MIHRRLRLLPPNYSRAPLRDTLAYRSSSGDSTRTTIRPLCRFAETVIRWELAVCDSFSKKIEQEVNYRWQRNDQKQHAKVVSSPFCNTGCRG